jgi:hypothetical protein
MLKHARRATGDAALRRRRRASGPLRARCAAATRARLRARRGAGCAARRRRQAAHAEAATRSPAGRVLTPRPRQRACRALRQHAGPRRASGRVYELRSARLLGPAPLTPPRIPGGARAPCLLPRCNKGLLDAANVSAVRSMRVVTVSSRS